MAEKKQNGLVSWLVTRPALFAVISFIAMTLASAIAGLVGANTAGPLTAAMVIVAFLGAAAWLIRTLPPENLDRRSFIAVNNAQTLITSVAFIASTLFIVANAQNIMLRMLWLESQSSASFLALIVLMALFYLYLCGIYIGNLYAKYRRVRAMGVSMWKTLATAPFGFCMLWIPGYLMNDTAQKNSVKIAQRGWYARATDWVVARPVNAALTLVVMVVLAGFTFGFAAIILTLGLGLVFAAWSAIAGPDNLRKKIGGAYATTAIVINIVALISLCTYFAVSHPRGDAQIQNFAPTMQNTPENA